MKSEPSRKQLNPKWEKYLNRGEKCRRLTCAPILPMNSLSASFRMVEMGAMKSTSAMMEHREKRRRLKQIAHSDELTGLPNRVLLADRLRKAIDQSKRWGKLLAVVRLKLEGLGAIYDRHGQEIGDRVLVSLAHGVKRRLGKGETLACFDGSKFALVMPAQADRQASMAALDRLLEAATEPVRMNDASFQLSASIGVSFYPQEAEVDAEELLRQASQAMHRARAAGRNRSHVFDPADELGALDAPEGIERIRQALAAQEFVLYYQPKVNMESGRVVSAEALIRWLHPQRGLLPAMQFLPAINDHPLAVEVGEWVIGAALEQMDKWLDAGLKITVCVNVGSRQLQQPGFAERLAAQLAAHPRIAPSSLELDIMETSTPEDAAQLAKQLMKCRESGITFALDDFGAGHISLNELKALPVDVLKIDPSFVRDILECPEDLAILEGVLGLATAFRRSVVAEGVETVEQGLMLLRLGCEMALGYGIAQPMRAEEFPAWVAEWRPDPRWAEAVTVAVDERPLLHAGVEHRAWAAAIEAYLKGESQQEPRLSRYQCQFGAWLYGEGPAGRSSLPAFQPIVALHWRIHALAAGIVKFHAQGRNEEGLARLGELKDQVDKLADLLNAFGQKSDAEPQEDLALQE
jgi:diguanylate cyclase (GGDEF)-like protein